MKLYVFQLIFAHIFLFIGIMTYQWETIFGAAVLFMIAVTLRKMFVYKGRRWKSDKKGAT